MLAISFSPKILRLGLACAILGAGLWLDCSAVQAQSAACPQLDAMLQSLDANPAYRDAGQSAENLMALQADERNAEQRPVTHAWSPGAAMLKPSTRSVSCSALAKAVASYAHQHGVIALTCGTWGNVIRFLPPLSISDELLVEGLEIIAAGLEAAK